LHLSAASKQETAGAQPCRLFAALRFAAGSGHTAAFEPPASRTAIMISGRWHMATGVAQALRSLYRTGLEQGHGTMGRLR
jgi:hypothetical protein